MTYPINPATFRKNRYDFPSSAHAAFGSVVRPLTADKSIADELSQGLGRNNDGGFHIIVDPAGVLGEAVAAVAAQCGAKVTVGVC